MGLFILGSLSSNEPSDGTNPSQLRPDSLSLDISRKLQESKSLKLAHTLMLRSNCSLDFYFLLCVKHGLGTTVWIDSFSFSFFRLLDLDTPPFAVC